MQQFILKTFVILSFLLFYPEFTEFFFMFETAKLKKHFKAKTKQKETHKIEQTKILFNKLYLTTIKKSS